MSEAAARARRPRCGGLGPALLAAAAALLLGLAPQAEAARGSPSVFGSREVRSPDLAPFPKWRGALERYFLEIEPSRRCEPGLFTTCHLAEWKDFLAEQEGRDLVAKLEAVNAFMNEHSYILDPDNWGVPDYWATPLQFFRKDGDCEDYAIAKFMSLRALGVANDRMRIVVLQDLNLRRPHAVLVVDLGARRVVLDNQIEGLVSASTIRHYRPIYSVNEEAWWLHRR